ncbi:hypothetical protein [Phaeobacter gallaeciensis]|uniref:hypothetical protein n=1 Tax=Phaeobacter gallaeciensis TaxID=60890 RepID=UPI00237FC482|nr:hypothetical protein [Phaeobacter gallaeciensis]MDE4142138.1 hypothetical protein [Phaeobacter gallaeciensis]MDE4150621.1 hypothetical protein [Phaeobacter gallaeciensis]MDE4154799.1 hypothetical protein [Phaeobacter gallaeciensis]MDE4230306.1 hypothetical protein [Phaeobacter gallaeciensis]MDE4259310.1 hypothetical protein [Phaeobacter gallaeciensis]
MAYEENPVYLEGERAQVFRRLFPKNGELLDLLSSKSELRRSANDALRNAQTYWPAEFARSCDFSYSCSVYDRFAPNAFAAYRDGHHWVCMSSGLIYVIAELAVRAASAMVIPDETAEGANVARDAGFGFRFFDEDFRGDKEATAEFFRQTHSFSQARLRVLNALWLDAQTLVWRHELFHASLGHTRFADAGLSLGSLNEAPTASEIPPKYHEIIKAMEFHADWAAYGSMIKTTRSDLDAVASDLVRRFGLRFRVYVMTTAVMLLPLFFRVAETVTSTKPVLHPSPETRLQTFLFRLEEIDNDKEREIWQSGARDAVQSFAKSGRQHADRAPLAQMLTEGAITRGQQDRNRCLDIFDELQDSLNRFAVLPLGHPHQGSVDPIPMD